MTDNIKRLEDKVDSLVDAVTKLVVLEERQGVMARTVESLQTRLTDAENKLNAWIQRGIGAWFVAAAAFAVWKGLHP